MTKIFIFDDYEISVTDPEDIDFQNAFYEQTYRALYERIAAPDYGPQINVDDIHNGELGFDVLALANQHGVDVVKPSARASNKERLASQQALRAFLTSFPVFSGFLMNTTSSARIAISNAELIMSEPCNADNFIEIKRIIDKLNLAAWTREADTIERQSGVSVLGTISETLLETAFESLVDGTNFFKITHSQVQSYGDFALMCLPNNLWISVKSNFARERLLASGYSNDILAVGFFQDPTEFTSPVRIRNLQRAGFLAMYCPDSAVTSQQNHLNTSTYQMVLDDYARREVELPKNINGKPFIRSLSSLGDDLRALLEIKDVRRRHTVGF